MILGRYLLDRDACYPKIDDPLRMAEPHDRQAKLTGLM